jgi:hypothetical protein
MELASLKQCGYGSQTPSDLVKNNNNQKPITNTSLLVKHTKYLGGDL